MAAKPRGLLANAVFISCVTRRYSRVGPFLACMGKGRDRFTCRSCQVLRSSTTQCRGMLGLSVFLGVVHQRRRAVIGIGAALQTFERWNAHATGITASTCRGDGGLFVGGASVDKFSLGRHILGQRGEQLHFDGRFKDLCLHDFERHLSVPCWRPCLTTDGLHARAGGAEREGAPSRSAGG